MKYYPESLILASGLLLASSYTSAQTHFFLSSSPQPNDCYGYEINACRALDAIEASGYSMARSGKIKWVDMVNRFYQERNRYFPHLRDDHINAEIRSYQSLLAERKDSGKITESEWVFLLSRQYSAIVARTDQSSGYAQQRQQQQQIQQMQSDQANFEQQQRMYQSNIEQQQQLQQQQIDQQRIQQQQMEWQQRWQRMQQR